MQVEDRARARETLLSVVEMVAVEQLALEKVLTE
jgi:hypothetical protein